VWIDEGDGLGEAAALADVREGVRSAAAWVAVATAAVVGARSGDFDRAVRLLAAVDTWTECAGRIFGLGIAVREVREEITARARHQMGDSAYESAVTEGRALSADDAVDLARAALEPLTRTPTAPAAAAGAGVLGPQRSRASGPAPHRRGPA